MSTYLLEYDTESRPLWRLGIHTHHRRRSNPEIYSVNMACLNGVNPLEFGEIRVADGLNHSKDND